MVTALTTLMLQVIGGNPGHLVAVFASLERTNATRDMNMGRYGYVY
jgi:hypothetical protein